jgi:hypothetical protein
MRLLPYNILISTENYKAVQYLSAYFSSDANVKYVYVTVAYRAAYKQYQSFIYAQIFVLLHVYAVYVQDEWCVSYEECRN